MRDSNLKFISPDDIYQTIEKCDNKKLKITYCSLTLNNQCITTKTSIIKINKINRNCGFIEGTILIDNQPVEDIILKSSQILSLECVKGGQKPDNYSVLQLIKKCNGLVRITQCTKFEKGICKESKNFNFMAIEIDEKNKNVKGYRIRENGQTEYLVLDASVILKVECLSPRKNNSIPFDMSWMGKPMK